MPKVSRWKLTSEELAQIREDLYAALTLLENKREVRHFLSRFWTPTERVMFAKRFQLVMMLLEEVPPQEIHNALHVSHDTISRMVSKLGEEENVVLIEIARRILDLREETRLQFRDRQNKRHAPGDLASPIAREGAKYISRSWFSRKRKKSAA